MYSFSFETGPSQDRRTATIHLPSEKGKKLLVAVSGGADSAILLYLMCKLNRDFDLQHTIQPLTVNKVDGAKIHSAAVISWIEKKLSVKLPSPIVGGNQNLPHDKIVNTFIRSMMATGMFDYVYIGENRIPPIPFPFGLTNDFPGLAPERKDNPSQELGVFLPFNDLYKTHTIGLYFELDCLELLEFTHTCTEQTVGRCGKCWQCGERDWAFRELGHLDPQTT